MKIEFCPYCKCNELYTLENRYKKCKNCNKKFSIKKHFKDLQIIEYFVDNVNALESSSIENINYRTVSNKYQLFRRLIANYLETIHQDCEKKDSVYEEYYYFSVRQKQKKNKSLYDAINIMGFYTNKIVYTLLMPKLPRSPLEKKERIFEKYLSWHKLQSTNIYQTPLRDFWKFLDENLKKYKGVNEDNFFYYLKECEFKYNFTKNEQVEILKNLYFNI